MPTPYLPKNGVRFRRKLTPRESEVARCVRKGMTGRQISENLLISEWTVKQHVQSIEEKLGFRLRFGVALSALNAMEIARIKRIVTQL